MGEARAERSLVGEYGAMSTRQSIRYEQDADGCSFHIFQDVFDEGRDVSLELGGVEIDGLETDHGRVCVIIRMPLSMAIKLGLVEP